jgi:hypothetical protein
MPRHPAVAVDWKCTLAAGPDSMVRELKEALNTRKPASDWLDRAIGSMKNEPAFDEVLAHGRAFRQADRRAEDPAPLQCRDSPIPDSSIGCKFSAGKVAARRGHRLRSEIRY